MHRSPRDGTVATLVLAAAAARPSTVLLSDRGEALTGAELRSLVIRLAGGLAGLGLSGNDVVAILPTTSVRAVAVRYAAALVGCATAYCPTDSAARAAAFAENAGATAVVVLPETAAAAARVPDTVRILDYDEILAAPAAPLPEPPLVSALGWLASSGGTTTGHASVSRRSFAEWRLAVSAPVDVTRRQLVCTSLVHVGQVLLDQTLVAGGTVVLRDYGVGGVIDPADVLHTIEAERISHLCLVEPQLVQLIDHPDLYRRDLRSCRVITHIGADAAPSLLLRLLRRLERGGLRDVLAHAYGASELGLVSLLHGGDYSTERIDLVGTAGRPLPGVDVIIERVDGSPADMEEEGIIVVRSAQVAPGVRSSGDVGRLDASGFLHVRGRATDARGSVDRPVFPVDVQDILCAHPDVRYAVAVPQQHGFDVVVVAKPEQRPDTTELLELLGRQVEPSLPPANVLVADAVPLTEQGKPDRGAIASMFRARAVLHDFASTDPSVTVSAP